MKKGTEETEDDRDINMESCHLAENNGCSYGSSRDEETNLNKISSCMAPDADGT